ncbi:hypothetical protein ACWEPL_04180 [Nonomuraea sp. NPDC004186]
MTSVACSACRRAGGINRCAIEGNMLMQVSETVNLFKLHGECPGHSMIAMPVFGKVT